MSFVVCSLWVDATPWVDDHRSPGRVGAVDQASFPSETNATSPSVWRAGDKGARHTKTCNRSGSAGESRLGQSHSSREARKLEKALEVMSDVDGPAVEALRVELKKAQNASAVPPLDVQIQQCESFISRSERRLAEIHTQRITEEESLAEARARLERLRSETIAELSVPTDWETEVKKLRQQVAELQCQKPLYSRVQASHPVQSSVEAVQTVQERAAKRRACAEEVPSTEQALAEWLCAKHWNSGMLWRWGILQWWRS